MPAPFQTNRTNRATRGLSATVVLIICIVASMALMALYSNEGDGGAVHSVRGIVATVASPFQRIGAIVSLPFQAVGNALTNAAAPTEDLLTLQQENERLRAQTIRYQEYQTENERLRALLDMKESYSLESTGARVISQSADSWNRTVTIDKGSADGLAVGMPVMNGDGLLGQIESVAPASSVVRLITDDTGGVSVILQNSRAEGVLSGNVDGVLHVDFVPISTQVQLGEAVLTSGLGGVYPKGLVVGAVTRIDGGGADTYYTLVVQPLGEINVNEEVLVLVGNQAEVTYVERSSEDAEGAAGAEGDAGAEGAEGAEGTPVDEGGTADSGEAAAAEAVFEGGVS